MKPTNDQLKEPKVTFLTPVPYVVLKKDAKSDLVVVSLKQLVKAQKDYEQALATREQEGKQEGLDMIKRWLHSRIRIGNIYLEATKLLDAIDQLKTK